MIRNMCRWVCNFLISRTRLKTRTRDNFFKFEMFNPSQLILTMFNPSSYDQDQCSINPSSQDQDSRSNTVERFWIIGAKNSPVHQRRQMKCLLVAITILLRSLFSLSLSQYLCHGLLRCFLRSYITKLWDQLRLMSSFVQISNAWLAFDDGRSNAFLWLSF